MLCCIRSIVLFLNIYPEMGAGKGIKNVLKRTLLDVLSWIVGLGSMIYSSSTESLSLQLFIAQK